VHSRCRVKLNLGVLSDKSLDLLDVLNKLDILFESRLLSSEEFSLKMSSLNELERVQQLGKTMWRQRARTLWLKQEDHNLNFFHRIANTRYRHNLIQTLYHQEKILTTHFDISSVFISYFSQIFGAPHHSLLYAN